MPIVDSTETEKRERLSELDFGLAMIVIESKGHYPLEWISSVKGEDERGVFYFPVITDYCNGKEYLTGNDDGYSSREQLLRCVGRCWDKATAHTAKLVAEMNTQSSTKNQNP